MSSNSNQPKLEAPLRLGVIGLGRGFMLTWIALGFIIAGAKVISWTLSDREAVKKLLVHAFGSTRKPQVGKKP